MQEIIKNLRSITSDRQLYTVFEDFVTMTAISLQNSVVSREFQRFKKLEEEFKGIYQRYDKEQNALFAACLAQLVNELDKNPKDILGSIFMELDYGCEFKGQFFTPMEISKFMAKMQFNDIDSLLKGKSFFTMLEPSIGAGGMVLAVAEELISQGYNPANTFWVQGIDISRIACLMAYVQLSLWNIPAEIIVGNTLTMEFREHWYTPAHVLNNWTARLRFNEAINNAKEFFKDIPPQLKHETPATDYRNHDEEKPVLINSPIFKKGEQIAFVF